MFLEYNLNMFEIYYVLNMVDVFSIFFENDGCVLQVVGFVSCDYCSDLLEHISKYSHGVVVCFN